jgi:hypothetical protein
VKLERVEQQRQKPPDGRIAAEQPLAVALLDRGNSTFAATS